MSEAFYTRDGDAFVPTGLGVSPWDPTKQGGAPISGLAAQILDGLPAPVPMLPIRLTIDLYGAVPMAAMTARTRMLRDGKRIQLAELELDVEGRTFVRASMLRVRKDGDEAAGEALTHGFPEGVDGVRRVIAESIRIRGSAEEPGPGALWMRVITPMIAGEPMNPLACVAAAADWGTTVAPPASLKDWTYANLDVSIHLARMPRSEWMLLDGVSEGTGNGTGIAHLRLGDKEGMFGTAHQSVFLNPRRENGL